MHRKSDIATILSIAVVVYALASFIHEGLGHGGACLAVGCQPQLLTSMQFQGDDKGLSIGASKFISAGGAIANLAAALAAILLLRRHATIGPARWFFLWLFATVNLLQATGYLLYSGFGGIGDWAAVVQGLTPAWLWRSGLAVIGGSTYWLVVRWSMRRLAGRLNATGSARVAEANRYTVISYCAGGGLSLLAGLFEPGGGIVVLISGAAASLGGTSALAWGPQLLHDPALGSPAAKPLLLDRDWRWISAAIVSAIFFVFVIGPGVRLHAGG